MGRKQRLQSASPAAARRFNRDLLALGAPRAEFSRRKIERAVAPPLLVMPVVEHFDFDRIARSAERRQSLEAASSLRVQRKYRLLPTRVGQPRGRGEAKSARECKILLTHY